MYLGNAEEIPYKAWMHILLVSSLILLSVPKDLALALFEWTDSTLMLSTQFLGSLLFYILLLSVWALARKTENPDSTG
ncbi:MAG: hypothetical protein EDM79_17560 [Chloroflexi bacterium]|nr:MAG: hypothetical protein EDM79_17560 [Chloroflexota bacterium]